LITTFGFFSIVGEPEHDFLAVRARTRRDLEELKSRFLPELGEILEGTGKDYKYAAMGHRNAVARAIGEIAMSIDYRDFRDTVLVHQGYRRASLYGRVSSMLWILQEEEQWFEPDGPGPQRTLRGPLETGK
jgi:hypothetical protein